ncbi:biotin holocarboxylase synthetase [Rhizopus stolonifer]|uniref:Biotin holocarboxylase synthetase n=1 Tax=Rhizopus stolonifer TaxID=4846 RepID=A0A367J0Q7_RHIST|nr:biotin holocarboxylase synthetase [Rhizopus stolonifer]
MNILVYDDLGASSNSVKHTQNTLKSLLGHAYDVITIDRKVLQSEPWEINCAMLVMPGGRDLPYCEALNGHPNARINHYVRAGGRYLGICAGAYYASKNIEFEKGNAIMEIIQPRELEFYPGLCKGTTYPGFVYNSESGASSVSVVTEKDVLKDVSSEIKMYYNGGGYFVRPEEYSHVTVLCRFKDHGPLCKDEPRGPAAVVHCKIEKGDALLIATHPEYDVSSEDLLLADQANSEKVSEILKDLVLSEVERKRFLCAAFLRMGLQAVPLDNNKIPMENKAVKITPLYISGLTKEWVHNTASYLIRKTDQRSRLLKDNTDIFCINELDTPSSEQAHILSLCRIKEGKSSVIEIIYPNTIYADEPVCPPSSVTPHFNIEKYYKYLSQERGKWLDIRGSFRFGNGLLYAEALSSTQSTLEKNPVLLAGLPTGLVCLAANQISGRGRGSNSWISHTGALQFSFVYMIALAIVESIREKPGYSSVPLRLKWPNDIYAECCGLNLSNTLPTTSINDIIKDHDTSLKELSTEHVLADIMIKFETYYGRFCVDGMGSWFLDKYYERWLHRY